MTRIDGRRDDELRTVSLEPGWAGNAEGSCLISAGDTRILCAASVEERVPPWREASGKGWVTGEYAMLPRSTHTRTSRERDGLRGRTQEIQRLIGRALRSVTDLAGLGPRTITVDCDVLQADGGTRTAAITGGWVALFLACERMVEEGRIPGNPVAEGVAAVSVGLVDGRPLLDLAYREDVAAQVDLNVVASASGGIVEVQGTAEGDPFRREELDALMDLALGGVARLSELQRAAVGGSGRDAPGGPEVRGGA